MDNNEQRNEAGFLKEPDRQIQLVVNNSDSNVASVDLRNVFHNMKMKKHIFAWLMVLCLLLGITAPLLLYQFTKPYLTVSSVVTLRYEVPKKVMKLDENGEEIWMIPDDPEYEMVTDLTAPDGKDLDLNQITSSYVLQTALDEMTLSQPITAANLRDNIKVQTVLTEESSRTKESLQGLAEAKSTDAYNLLLDVEIKYENRFVVTLTNGFGEEDSRTKLELKEEELKMVLDRILTVYNQYLVKTYADVKLPEDKFSGIDTQELDVMNSLDELRAGVDALITYGEAKTDTVKDYRSWKNGYSLKDWISTIKAFKSINIDYLYTTVSENAITRDKKALLTSYKYLLRIEQNNLQKIEREIEETDKILKSYKNDDIYISMQESDGSKTTKAATEYYNSLILQQTKNYDKARELKTTVLDYEDRILHLEAVQETQVTEGVEAELARSISTAQYLYSQVRDHMKELYESPMYTTFEEHSVPQGKEVNFLVASAKKMVIGTIAGFIVGFGIWFLAGLSSDFSKGRKEQDTGKEAARK